MKSSLLKKFTSLILILGLALVPCSVFAADLSDSMSDWSLTKTDAGMSFSVQGNNIYWRQKSGYAAGANKATLKYPCTSSDCSATYTYTDWAGVSHEGSFTTLGDGWGNQIKTTLGDPDNMAYFAFARSSGNFIIDMQSARDYNNPVAFNLTFTELVIDGNTIVTSYDDTPYFLQIPKGYALVIDENYHGTMQVRYNTIGNTESVSLDKLPVFYAGTASAGTILGSELQFTLLDGVFVANQNITFYEGVFDTVDNGNVLILPALSVLTLDGSGAQRPLYNANITSRLEVGGYFTDIPYEALSLVPITQSHATYNYVTFDTANALHAVLNPEPKGEQDKVIWSATVSDNIPSDDDILHDGASGFWEGLKNLFSSGSDILNGLVQSASGFLLAFASMFSWLPDGFVNLFYSALVIILIVGIIKVFL